MFSHKKKKKKKKILYLVFTKAYNFIRLNGKSTLPSFLVVK